ncbi:YbaB/EbfC family DNA-binding protein [Mycobacterium deserti]|uniref:YbaB/EbfC family DNA-binding protein n=1 Tax=Mycobacterium deserti TaxID=2978347 RepID=A0ABT2MGX3_9MYCO|nr:YbaB/EbfC family DNA-binding protein [Mycobacterium deserti]MCT7661241.1 YbaB/EbfC family DNA-binding protein [Mycobacterium deserti]
MGERHPDDSDDERDDLSALDFFDVGDTAGGSDLDALDFAPIYPPDEPLPPPNAAVEDVVLPMHTVTNPPGTVTVTTYMDGRVQHIELSPKVADMTEADLADEIVVIARLATQDAKSAQYAYMLDGMREQGHDDAATRDFLTRDLDLPTPEQAQAAQAEVFATRYGGDHD